MKITCLLAAWLTSACAILPISVLAAELNAAEEEQLRQIERERVLREQLQRIPDVRLEQPEVEFARQRIPVDEMPCFPIRRIALKGDFAERFRWALHAANPASDPAIDRCLGSTGINLVMRRVQNAIIARGYVTTRVLAEPQDLQGGELVLRLIPGRIRAIRFADGTDDRASLWNAIPARPGDLLNLRDIEQSLENFKRLPTADADIQIAPGEQPGESDVIIGWKQAFPARLNLSADDSGSKSTGQYLGGVTVALDHMLTLNDLFYLSLNRDLGGGGPGDNGIRSRTAHYSAPYGYWLLGLTANDHTYHQSVAGINQTYIFSGETQNSDVKLSRLVYRDAVRKTSVSLRGWTRASKNFIDDTEIEIQRRRTSGWETGVGHREFIGRATLDMNLAYRRGTGAMDALPAPEEAVGAGASRLKLVTADAQLALPFELGGQSLRYSLAWRAQWNRAPLVPQDRFAIGGRYTVRGFDGENLLSADRGWLIRNDLGLSLGGSGQALYLGTDYGEVSGPSSALLAGKRLAGMVLGLRGGYKRLGYDIFAGQPLSKPEGFKTANTTTGFNLNASF
ncbi:MAG: ShlB/FhaC/HecB family hemolysin secretion/activation protein [Thiobacillus sp.]|jgi:hemolysin activation/secretion protein|uniref:ShlB/FhaC/HecB family hemolysin secretion/activation protein n=1 Tax=Thiobacillus sp. TaxID=924 RepID=UPI002894BAD9|nr:ShlB/FhaC/HecB family hemolysin secretion/activation protein [Thiobacillus sp.]MDT3705798.1 ShlB/FhaC/HecB family hemolysin secretion/activation protein [Thiobacillus sp.]